MQAKPSRNLAEQDVANDWLIMLRLLDEDDQRPWSVEELIRDRGERVSTLNSINRLQRAGLVHHVTDGYVFASKAAVYMAQIVC